MTPKNERFEMRLETVTLERIDGWRAQQSDNPSRAESVRRFIDAGLSTSTKETVSFSDGEKLILWILSEWIKKQDGEFDIDTDLLQGAILGGHYWALPWEMVGIFHGHEDKNQTVTEVVDILDMWNFLERAYAGLSKASKDKVEAEIGPHRRSTKFLGFDGQNESEHMNVALFLIQKMGRFSTFKERSLNSHSPVLERYKSMSRKFEPMRNNLLGRELSADEIIALLQVE